MSEDQMNYETLPVIRCSSLPRLAACPGSLYACMGLESPDTEQATAGTKAHKVLENYYNAKAVGNEYDLEESGLDPMYLSRARTYAQAVDALIEEHGSSVRIMTEHEMAVKSHLGFALSGHADLIVECKDGLCIIVDWKFNFLEVESAGGNLQLMGYACLWNSISNAQDIMVVLAAGGNEKPLTGTRYDESAILSARKTVYRICFNALNQTYPRLPGFDQCLYCPAKATDKCPESWQSSYSISLATKHCVPATIEDKVRMFNAIKQVESFGKKFMAMLKDEVEANPEAYAGKLELKNTGSTRTVTDAQEAYRRIVGGGLIDAEAFLGLVDLPIGKLESALKGPLKEQGIRVGEQKAHIEGLLSGVIEYKEKAKSLKAVAE